MSMATSYVTWKSYHKIKFTVMLNLYHTRERINISESWESVSQSNETVNKMNFKIKLP